MRSNVRNPYEHYDATVVRWLKGVGDPVSSGDGLCELTCRGNLSTVRWWADGFLAETLFQPRETVRPSEVLAVVVTDRSELPEPPRPPVVPALSSSTPREPATTSTPGAAEIGAPSSQAPVGTSAAVKTRQNVFVCYRRDDTQDAAGRLYDRLTDRFGADRVFMDIDNIPLGVNFVTHIEAQLRGCAAVLVVIGRSWTTIADQDGQRRLDSPADHVRTEVATALDLGVPVIPILVQNANMPAPADLPEDIRDLAFHNGLKLAPEFWRAGVDRLIKELDRVMKG